MLLLTFLCLFESVISKNPIPSKFCTPFQEGEWCDVRAQVASDSENYQNVIPQLSMSENHSSVPTIRKQFFTLGKVVMERKYSSG